MDILAIVGCQFWQVTCYLKNGRRCLLYTCTADNGRSERILFLRHVSSALIGTDFSLDPERSCEAGVGLSMGPLSKEYTGVWL